MRGTLLIALPVSMVLALGAASCGEPATRVGGVCQTSDHCGGGENNLALVCDNSIPGGSCTVTPCTPDDPATPEAEDKTSCPEGSRCVRECPAGVRCDSVDRETVLVCRRGCSQQADCHEVIVCGPVCTPLDGGGEECHEECKNQMECIPFWDLASAELSEKDDPPRACVLKGRHYRPL
jgi:hypothetical protein